MTLSFLSIAVTSFLSVWSLTCNLLLGQRDMRPTTPNLRVVSVVSRPFGKT